jgi:hypothetical protein
LVIAYLALFVALGGSAYAVTQLPKNSVGAKQLKPNAVTAAKIKNGAVDGAKIQADSVTGANIAESTLGRVPSAASAESATTAGHAATATSAASASNAARADRADEASTLGGVPAGDFLRTNAVQFHTGALNACYEQTLADVPGWFEITTVGDCQNAAKITIENLSSETWDFFTPTGGSFPAPSDNTLTINFGSAPFIELFAISTGDTNRHAVITCAYQATTAPPRISCSTRVPPAA